MGTAGQAVRAFNADDACAAACQGQGKVAQSAKQIGNAFMRLRVEQADGARHHLRVHGQVDLGEVAHAEGHVQIKFGQSVIQFRCFGRGDGLCRLLLALLPNLPWRAGVLLQAFGGLPGDGFGQRPAALDAARGNGFADADIHGGQAVFGHLVVDVLQHFPNQVQAA